MTSKIRPVSFEVEWIIQNFETLAMAEVEELKFNHFNKSVKRKAEKHSQRTALLNISTT